MSENISQEAKRLDLDDIRFLKAVRDISSDPDEYENTEGGESPATTSAIDAATSPELTRSKIKYRLRKGREGRRFAEDGGMGYIRVYDAPLTDSGFGPKSCDITEKGLSILTEAQEVHGLSDRETADEVDHERLVKLENQVEEISESVEKLANQQERILEQYDEMQSFFNDAEDSEFGAVDPEQIDRIRRVRGAMVDFVKAFDVLGIDFEEFQSIEELTEKDRQRFQEAILKTLLDSQAAETVLTGDGVEVDTAAGDGDAIEADSSPDNRPLDSYGDGEGELAETESDAE